MARHPFPLIDLILGFPSTGKISGGPVLQPHGATIELFSNSACTAVLDARNAGDTAAITSTSVDGITLLPFLGPDDDNVFVVYGRLAGQGGAGFPIYRSDYFAAPGGGGGGGSAGITGVQATRTTDGALVASKHNPVDASGGPRAVTLADAATAGLFASYEKIDGSTNTVTLTAKFRGAGATSGLPLTWQNESILLVSAADGTWWPVSGHRTKSSLEAGLMPRSAPAGALPAGMGRRPRPYDPTVQIYGSDAARVKARRGLGFCFGSAKSSLVNLLIVGDSFSSGWKANQIGGAAGDDWATMLKAMLREQGYPLTGGWVPAGNGSTPADARWTFTGTWTRNYTESNYVYSGTAGSTATFTSDDLGTVLEVAAFSGAASVQRSIDGGASAAWAMTANQVTVQVNAGLANGTHSVTLTVPASGGLWLIGARVRQTTGLSISNMAIFGSHTDDWLPSYGVGLGSGGSDISWLKPYKATRSLVGGVAPTLAIVCLGANDAIHSGHTPASMKANLATIINAYQSAGAYVLQRWYMGLNANALALINTAQAAGVTWEQFVQNAYDVADTYDTAIVDHTGTLGDPATLQAANLIYTDGLHLLTPGQAAIARADVKALVGI